MTYAPGLPRALLPLPLLRDDSPSPALVEASVALPAEGEGGVTSWGIGCVASKCLQTSRMSHGEAKAHAQLEVTVRCWDLLPRRFDDRHPQCVCSS